ncbi:hypothetical protein [Pectinatus frisingensis]
MEPECMVKALARIIDLASSGRHIPPFKILIGSLYLETGGPPVCVSLA